MTLIARAGSLNGIVYRVPPSVETDFTITAVATPIVVSGGSTSTLTVNDANVTRTTGATVDNVWHVSTDANCEFTSLDTGIATVDADSGQVSWVSNGNARIRARAYTLEENGTRRYYLTKEITVYVSRGIGTTVDTLNYYTPGTLARHLCDQIDSRIATAASGDRLIFSSANYAASEYTRNSSCWTNNGTPLDTTCIGISAGPAVYPNRLNRQNGTVISPTVVIFANHNHPEVGLVLDFVTMAGATVQRTITAIDKNYTLDMCLAKLDSALPGTITPAKLWPQPAAWITRLPSLARDAYTPGTFGVPMFFTDQEKKALVDLNYASTPAPYYSPYVYGFETAPAMGTAQRLSFWEPWVSGDSGSGMFFVFENNLVLRRVLSGVDAPYYYSTIASVLSGWGSSAAQVADVSAYPAF